MLLSPPIPSLWTTNKLSKIKMTVLHCMVFAYHLALENLVEMTGGFVKEGPGRGQALGPGKLRSIPGLCGECPAGPWELWLPMLIAVRPQTRWDQNRGSIQATSPT